MATAFNPYRAWLGVESRFSTPTHYELLGVAPAKANGEAIAEGFRRQMSRLNPHMAGEHGALAQKVATELSNARVVLLTPTTKKAYDAELAARIKAKQGSAPNRPQPQAKPAPQPSADDLLPPSAGPLPPAAPEPTATLVQPPVPNAPAGGPPLHQPPPPGMAASYPPTPPAAGHAPQAYGQPYPQAYPAGGSPQPVQAYPYGQPYPQAAQPYPGQQAYPHQQAYPPQAAPSYPAGGYPAAAAPQQAPVEIQPDPEIASLPSGPSSPLSRTAGRKRSSPVPMLVGLTVAGAVVVGGVIYFVKSDAGAQVAANKPSAPNGGGSQPSPAHPAPSPAAGKSAPATQATSTGQRRSDAVAPSPKRTAPVIAPKMASDQSAPGGANSGGSKEKLFQPDGNGENMTDSPKPNENPEGMKPEAMEGEKPGAPASDANKAASASAAMPEESEMPAEIPEDKAAVEKALNAARQALAKRDLAGAEIELAQATLEATSRESLAKVDRLQLLTLRIGEFWNAVRETLPSLQAGESLDVQGEEVSIVEASAEKIVVRVAGRNREYQTTKMPAKLALTLASRWLNKDNPVSPAVLGAFQAVDPDGDRQQARLLFQQARAGGINVDGLLEELDATEGAGS
ncbi:MAG TPA: hypothetical protein VHC19_15105 [Pirellulales bacterium]|jgi:hypothetical protein|nr:hypothetical protein [Pirellulales bacterium]